MAALPSSDPALSGSLATAEASDPARLRAALSAGSIALWEWDATTNAVRWFEGVAAMFGIAAEDFDGTLKHALSMIHSEDRDRVRHGLEQAVRTGRDYVADFRILRPDGEMRWLASRGKPLGDRQGRPQRVVGTVTDITDQKGAQQNLARTTHDLEQVLTERTMELEEYAARVAQSEQQYRAIGETLPYGVWICGADGELRYLSEEFLKLVGMSFDYALRCPFEHWAPAEEQPTFRRKWNHCLATGEEWDYQYQITDTQGQPRTVLSRGRPVRDGHGHIRSWVGINLDITDRTRAEQLLEQREAQLDQLDRMGLMGELASGLAHELNQPLAAIGSYAQGCLRRLDRDTPDVEGVRFGLNSVLQQAERAGRIIRHLREFARVGEPMYTRVAINDLINEVVELVNSELQGARVALVLELDDTLPDLRLGHIEIQQVLLNIIRNAVEAMSDVPPDQRELTIQSTMVDLNYIRVAVHDTGPGISDEALAHIFDPFYTTKDSGMGVGLNLCETLVHHHRGKLWAERNEDGGLTFFLKLPIQPPNLTADNEAC